MHHYEIFVREWKSISVFPGWTEPEAETAYVWFDAPLEIGGITEAGLFLHGGCYIDRPDRHVTFELRFRPANRRQIVELQRLDWRSLNGGHTNNRGSDPIWSRKRVSETHLHDFDLNWVAPEKRMRAGLPIAKEVDYPLQSYGDLLKYVGKQFKINNIEVAEIPRWQYRLL